MRNSILFTTLFIVILSCKNEKEEIVDITSKTEKQNGISKSQFYEKGKLKKTLEYVNVCGKDYLNQGWYFNDQGDTVKTKGNFYKIEIEKKVLKPLEESKVTMYYKPFLKNAACGILLPDKTGIDYCELKNQKCDTFYFVNNKLEYFQVFKKKGRKKVTGYILEVSKEPKKTKDGNEYANRTVYFTLNFDVK